MAWVSFAMDKKEHENPYWHLGPSEAITMV